MAQATINPTGFNRNRSEKAKKPGNSTTFLHSVAFVFGFGLVFTLLGSAAGLLGQSLTSYLPIIQRGGAILLLIFALTTLGVFRRIVNWIEGRFDTASNRVASATVRVLNFFNTLLYTEKRVSEMHNVKKGWGYLSSMLMGVSFSSGWVPCVGPILASILFVASDSATATTGAILLAVYSLGLGIPFLITGAAFGRASQLLRRLNRHAGIVSMISGIFLLYVAYLLWFDQLTALTGSFAFLNEAVFGLEEAAGGLLGVSAEPGAAISTNVITGAPVAFIAGLISFLSPCVLPLIPAYIGYLSGRTLAE